MSLLEDLISAMTALAGLTGKNGHIYKTSEEPGIVLVTVQQATKDLRGINKDAIHRPFQLKLFAKDQTTQDTFLNLMKAAVKKAITNGFWDWDDEQPDYKEVRRNIILFGHQMKVE